MTKSELIETVANQLKLPKGKAELIVNCVFDSMEAALKQGERIEIRGFGSFEIRHYKAYEGRNPRTGDKVDVRPKRLPFFKVGKELKERVNMMDAAISPASTDSQQEVSQAGTTDRMSSPLSATAPTFGQAPAASGSIVSPNPSTDTPGDPTSGSGTY